MMLVEGFEKARLLVLMEVHKVSRRSKSKRKKSVSFSQPLAERFEPEVVESLEESLCRSFGFTSGEKRVSNYTIRQMMLFLERSARALGFFGAMLEGGTSRFTPQDADRWNSFAQDDSVSLDDLNMSMANNARMDGFLLTQKQIDTLTKSKERFKEHKWRTDEYASKCADCEKMQKIWCENCEACEECSKVKMNGDICIFEID